MHNDIKFPQLILITGMIIECQGSFKAQAKLQ